MADTIQFYFDFSSPYSYIASEKIDELAARYGRTVDYRPILLGPIFKATGGAPLTELVSPKAGYAIHDFARSARYAGVPFQYPSKFPVGTVTAARAVLWLKMHRPTLVAPFVHATFRAFFAEDRNISDADVILEVARSVGIDAAELTAGVQQTEVKERLKTDVDQAIAAGIFGAPTIVVDGEVFWGNDRLPQIERWLADGPY